jgi:pullulanase
MAMKTWSGWELVVRTSLLVAFFTVGASAGDAVATPLGAAYTPESTTFSIWSPDSSDVQLSLQGEDHLLPTTRLPDTDDYSDVYSVTVPGDHHLKTYNFRIDGRTVRDPLGVMVEPASNNNVVVDLSLTEPADGWVSSPPLAGRTDAVIYEVNVRDFTLDPSSGVSEPKRGTFLGMVEHGSRIEGRATGIDHLVDLGVSHVQIMPMFDYRACSALTAPNPQDCYNWGYDPQNFNVPEENYSQFPNDPIARIRELKTMINEFHKSGIRVIMDVVYNHVPVVENGRDDVFGDITSRYFLPRDISGAGKSLDGGVPMVSQMIRYSLDYWVRDYHIDGFRFDLMGVFRYLNVGDWARYLNTRYPDRTLLIYGEPYAAGDGTVIGALSGDLSDRDEVRQGTVAYISADNVGVFSTSYRDAIRGGDLNGGGTGGYMFDQSNVGVQVQPGSRGSIRFSNKPYQPLGNLFDPLFGARPDQSINYISVHDNLCLRDRILAWAVQHDRSGDEGYLTRIQEFGTGIVLTSQGIPFLSEGDEILRSKEGNSNSFNVEAPNIIKWDLRVTNEDVFNYFKSAIAIRRAHRAFRLASWEEVNGNVSTSVPRGDVLVNDISPVGGEAGWERLLIIYNSGNNFQFTLPPGAWQVAMERSQPVDQERTVTGTVTAEGTAVTVLHR